MTWKAIKMDKQQNEFIVATMRVDNTSEEENGNENELETKYEHENEFKTVKWMRKSTFEHGKGVVCLLSTSANMHSPLN